MNIVFSIHLYLPEHTCGAELMAHWMIKDLQNKGHNIRVLLHAANKYKIQNNYCYDGVDVFPPNQNVIENLMRWADIVFTHLDYTRWTIGICQMFNKPLFHIIHNSYLYPEIVDAEYKNYIVYNSQWIKEKLNYKHPSYILPPPVDYRYYDVGGVPDHNTYYTLINVNENKGGHILVDIAKAMPHKQFLGVIGSYDEQITQKLPNLTYIDKTTDIREVMKKTRVLLMPSEYESWGRTATEAMSSGIPVICTDTPGLVENCGKAGIYIKDRNDIESWVQEIKKLDDAKAYLAASKKAKARSREHDPREALDGFEKWVREMANK